MGKYPDAVNKYNHTPRKVFDKYTEKIERKMARIVADQVLTEKAFVDLSIKVDLLMDDIDALEERFVVLEDYLQKERHR